MTHLEVNIQNDSLNPQIAVHKPLEVELNRRKDLEVELQARSLWVVLSVIGIVGKDEYLQVSPTTMWVTPDMIQELLIKSNVDWVIT